MEDRLNEIIDEYKNFSQVIGIAFGGSSSAKTSDSLSEMFTNIKNTILS